MTDKEKIRAYIEKLHKEHRGSEGDSIFRKALRTVLFYIDSMQEEPVSEDWVEELRTKLDSMSKEDFKKVFDKYAVDFNEEPVSEDLIEELKKIVNIRECVSQGVPVIKIARHFANWQKQQIMKVAVDGTAQTYLPFESIRFIGKPLRELGLKTNNPVKVIIIKEN